MKIALFFAQDAGPHRGYKAYADTSLGWLWLGGFSNYVDPNAVKEFAAKNNHELVPVLPAKPKMVAESDFDKAYAEVRKGGSA